MNRLLIILSFLSILGFQVSCNKTDNSVEEQKEAMERGNENMVAPGKENPQEALQEAPEQ